MRPGGKRTGVRLRELAARWFDAPTMQRCIDPVLADLQAEYEEAVRRSRTSRSRWIWIRGHAVFLTTVVCCSGGQAMRMLRDLSGSDRTALRRTAACSSAIFIAGTLLLAAVPLQSLGAADRPGAAGLAVYLVPQALPLSIPLGLTLGVIWGMGGGVVSRRSRVAVLLAAAALSVTSFGILGWLAPATNQAFRVAIYEGQARRNGLVPAGELPKGANELTFGELRNFLHFAGESREPPPDDSRHLAGVYHLRLATAGVPLVLSLFALAVIGSGQRSRLMLAVASAVAVFGYFLLEGAAGTVDWLLPAFAIAWLPNTVFAAAAVGTLLRSRRRLHHCA
jgi:lipopolysaccharide export LptBFGC system permease protein LptF